MNSTTSFPTANTENLFTTQGSEILMVINTLENLLDQVLTHGEAGYRTNEYTDLKFIVMDIANHADHAHENAQIALWATGQRLNFAAALTNPELGIPQNRITPERVQLALSSALAYLRAYLSTI